MDAIHDTRSSTAVYNIASGVWFCIKIPIIFVKHICDMRHMPISWALVIVNLKKINLLGLSGEQPCQYALI